MNEINKVLNDSLTYLSEIFNSITSTILIIIIFLFLFMLLNLWSTKQESAFKDRYDEYKYFSSKIRRDQLVKAFVGVLIIQYINEHGYLSRIDNICTIFLIIFLIYTWVKSNKYIAYTACHKYCRKLQSNKKNYISKGEAKNKNELTCNEMFVLTKRRIEREKLKLEILKYLVSPAIITSFISFIINSDKIGDSTLLLTLLLILMVLLWITYQKIDLLYSELYHYEAALYNLKNKIKFTEDDVKEYEKLEHERYLHASFDMMDRRVNYERKIRKLNRSEEDEE